jgi:long-chain acyl-CoA synthetase
MSDCTYVGQLIDRLAGRFGAKTAFADSAGRQVSFAGFAKRYRRLAGALHGLGLEPGARVALLSRNRVETLEVILLGGLGFVSVPLNWRLSARELLEVLRNCGPSAIVADSASADLVGALPGQIESLKHLIALDETPEGWHAYEDLIASGGDVPTHSPQPEDPICLVHTSGTTGLPKGAILTHASVFGNATLAREGYVIGISENDRCLNPLPLFHVGGMWYNVFPSFAVGATNVVMADFSPRDVLSLMASEAITTLAVVPTMLHGLITSPDVALHDRTQLRLITYAASSIPVEVLRRSMATFPGADFSQGYGSTEAGVVTGLRPEDHRRAMSEPAWADRLTSCGRPVPGVEIRLTPVPGLSEGGEIAVRSPGTMRGYWNNKDATGRAVIDGFVHTGDIARRDSDGFYYILDRRNDMIVTGGENVFPREVEDVLFADLDIAEAAVFDLPDDKWVQKVVAAIVLKPGSNCTASEIQGRLHRALAGYKCPKEIFIVETLPKSPAGKVLRKELRRLFVSPS